MALTRRATRNLAVAVPPKQEGESSEAHQRLISAVTPPPKTSAKDAKVHLSKAVKAKQTAQATIDGQASTTQCKLSRGRMCSDGSEQQTS
jgi:hypothetical protein